MPLREHCANPVCQATGSLLQASHVGAGAQDEQAPDIFVAASADPEKIVFRSRISSSKRRWRCTGRVRQGFVGARTAQANQIRGLLAEFGLVVPQGLAHVMGDVRDLIEDASNELPGSFRRLVERLLDHLKELDRQVNELEAQIKGSHRKSEASRKLEKIPGIGPITASALVATIGDERSFRNGRQLAAWMGLVPTQSSSGGKTNLLGISKRGDIYLRTLLIHGARSAVRAFQGKADQSRNPRFQKLLARRNHNVAAVALANKNARIVWALLACDREYTSGFSHGKASVVA